MKVIEFICFKDAAKLRKKFWNSKHSRQNLAKNCVKTIIPHPFITRTITLTTYFYSISCIEKVTV